MLFEALASRVLSALAENPLAPSIEKLREAASGSSTVGRASVALALAPPVPAAVLQTLREVFELQQVQGVEGAGQVVQRASQLLEELEKVVGGGAVLQIPDAKGSV